MENETHTPSTDAPSLDTYITLLSDPRHRSIVTVLSEREAPIGLRELVTAITVGETETGSNSDAAEPFNTVGVALHHHHLPKLDDTGIIDYDTETNTVTSVRTEELAPVMRLLEEVSVLPGR